MYPFICGVLALFLIAAPGAQGTRFSGALTPPIDAMNKKNKMEPFLRTILAHPSLFTTIVSPSGEGMSVSYKTR